MVRTEASRAAGMTRFLQSQQAARLPQLLEAERQRQEFLLKERLSEETHPVREQVLREIAGLAPGKIILPKKDIANIGLLAAIVAIVLVI